MDGNVDSCRKLKPQVVEVDQEAFVTEKADGEDVEGRARDEEHVVEDDYVAGKVGGNVACAESWRRSCRRAETPSARMEFREERFSSCDMCVSSAIYEEARLRK